MNIINIIFDIVSTLALILGFSVLGEKLRPNIKRYAVVMLFVTMIMLLVRYVYIEELGAYAGIVMYIGAILVYALVMNVSVIRSVMVFIFALLFIVIVESIMFTGLSILKVAPQTIFNMPWLRISTSLGELILLFIVKKWLPIKRIIRPIERYYTVLVFIIINLFLFITVLKISIDIGYAGGAHNDLALLIITLIAAVISVLIIVSYVKETQKTKRLEKYNELKQAVAPLIENSIRINHDFKNHLNVVKTYIGKDNEKGLSYINTINEAIQAGSEYLKWNNPIFGALIQRKMSEAKQKQIDFSAVPYGVDHLFPIEDYQFSSIIMNLLDNAFDAVMSLPVEERKVKLALGLEDNIYISVMNRGHIDTQVISNMFNRGFSTKGNSRGMGLYSIKNLVAQKGGEIEVTSENNEIEIRILFAIETDKKSVS